MRRFPPTKFEWTFRADTLTKPRYRVVILGKRKNQNKLKIENLIHFQCGMLALSLSLMTTEYSLVLSLTLLLVHPLAKLGTVRDDRDHLQLVRRLEQVLGVRGGRITVGAARNQQPDVGVQRQLARAGRLESDEKNEELIRFSNEDALVSNSPQMDRVAQQLHLFGVAELLDVPGLSCG